MRVCDQNRILKIDCHGAQKTHFYELHNLAGSMAKSNIRVINVRV